ncbi:MAG: hypothetical protein LBL24_02550 [Bacteroidales bacterium]|jgi:hypothetical protein|nr:hypothetical protein [Bacteroidales bacterium]
MIIPMHTKFTGRIKNCLPVLLIFASSCAKEVYTSEDAVNSKREAQKTGLTVMIRDINSQTTDMSGFSVTASQCGEDIKSVTSADGIASLMLVKGDAVLQVEKEHYVAVTAVVTTGATVTERNNTVVIIPVFADEQTSGTLDGTVSVKMTPSDEEPLADALVSIDVDMNDLMRLAFPGMSGNIDKYRPGALAYSSAGLMQPVRTSVSGAFRFAIPATVADLTYTVNVHETALTQHVNRTVVTNGRNSPVIFFHLTPYEK